MIQHSFTPDILHNLGSLCSLDEKTREETFSEIGDLSKKIQVSEALPFAPDTTFSLELAFPFNPRNLSQTYPRDIPLPPGWKWGRVSEIHCEFCTASPQKDYHENLAADWDSLRNGIDQVQSHLPAGFFIAHMHIGCKSVTENGELKVSTSRFGRLVKVYEAFWRVLAGYGYSPSSSRKGVYSTYGLNFIETQDRHLDAIWEHPRPREEGVYYHQAMINLSQRYPTVEVKILSGLIGARMATKHLDTEYLKKDLWWVFALFQCLKDTHRTFPLATMGLPTISGEKPSWDYICHFLDTIYDRDLFGKMIALRQFLKIEAHTTGGSTNQLIPKKMEAYFTFDQLGLGLVYELHEEQGGWDRDLENRILATPSLFNRLKEEIRTSEVKNPLTEYFADPQLIQKLSL